MNWASPAIAFAASFLLVRDRGTGEFVRGVLLFLAGLIAGAIMHAYT